MCYCGKKDERKIGQNVHGMAYATDIDWRETKVNLYALHNGGAYLMFAQAA